MNDFNPSTANEEVPTSLKELLTELLFLLYQNPTDQELFYDSADLKRLLKISDKTLYRMRKRKKIPFRKLGNKYFYPKKYFIQKALE